MNYDDCSFTCVCGKTVKTMNRKQHCSSKYHRNHPAVELFKTLNEVDIEIDMEIIHDKNKLERKRLKKIGLIR